jgi:plastocyanin
MRNHRSILQIMTAFTIIAISVSIAGPPYAKSPGDAKTSGPASQPTSAVVKIENFTFEPKELDIAVGTMVTWSNADDIPHTATSRDEPPAFDSGALDTDEKFSFTFTKLGTYAYYCKVHPHMRGVVVVK